MLSKGTLTVNKPSEAALRAARQIERNSSYVESVAEIIDRETGLRELVDVLEAIIAQAGDLIEGRSPELVMRARAALLYSADQAPRED